MLAAVLVTAGLALLFLQRFYLHMVRPYQGRHHLNKVETVPQTYHPSDSAWVPVPVKNRAWWNARMARVPQVSYLALPLKEFIARGKQRAEQFEQEALAWLARDYRWMDIPLSEWPKAWLEKQARVVVQIPITIAGSDLPSRTIEMRMAA